MSLIKVELSMPPIDGMDIKFKAPCACTEITGLLVEHPEGSQEFTFRDCHGANLAGIGNLFGAGAYVKVIIDTKNGYAYLQNADNNSFLNTAVLGTYTHDGENLTGYGENGKFKATTSGEVSAINVNGAACSVRCGEESSIELIAGNWYTFILDGDVVNFNSGGAGGGGLNFKVVGSLQPPVSPKENMIWIETDVPITSWIFSATEPDDPAEGMAWIVVGTSSTVEFNALKKQGIQVYPISANQYIGGTWVNVTAKSYQGDAWVDWWNGELYDSGNKFVSITGGWYTDSLSDNGSATIGGVSIDITYTAVASAYTVVTTNNEIDMSRYTSLCFDMEVSSHYNEYNNYAVVGVTGVQGQSDNGQNVFISSTRPNVDGKRRKVSVDISTVDKGYVTISGILKAKIFKIWME